MPHIPSFIPARTARRRAVGLLLAGLALGRPGLALAADTAPAAPKPADGLAAVRAHIAARRWTAALAELQRLGDIGSADWNNLMGYCLRKTESADLAGAGRHYAEALRIDPRHRGALEYSGELALMQGDLPTAEQRLAQLDKVCSFGCEEYTDLKQAVQRYKAAGNRWQPS